MFNRLILLFGLALWVSSAQATLITPFPSDVITANLDIYDVDGQLLHRTTADGSSLYSDASVTFSDPSLISPFVIHDFAIIEETPGETVVSMLLDWGLSSNVYTQETWILSIGDDFFTGTVYYFYDALDTDGDGIPGNRLTNVPVLSDYPVGSQFLTSGMTVDFSLDIVSRPTPIPIPAPFWLLFSGLLGGYGASRMRRNQGE